MGPLEVVVVVLLLLFSWELSLLLLLLLLPAAATTAAATAAAVALLPPSLPTIEAMLKPIFCFGVGIMTAEVGTGGIILVINSLVTHDKRRGMEVAATANCGILLQFLFFKSQRKCIF